MLSMSSLHRVAAAGLVLSGGFSAPARADDLTSLLPTDTNALIVIDASAIAGSPVATKEQWFDKTAERKMENPLLLPKGATKVVVGTQLDARQDVTCGVSVADLAEPVAIDAIAAGEGGHVEKVGDKPGVATPGNAYFVALSDHRLATIYPANRQVATRVANGAYKGISSKYLLDAINASGASPLLFAIDTDGMISAGEAYKAFDERPIAALADAGIDPRDYGQLLSTLKGITLNIAFADDVTGQAVIQFGSDPSLVKGVVKPLVLQTLSRRGFNIVEFSNWDFRVDGNTIRGQGKLTAFTLKRLLSLADAPVPSKAEPATAGAAPTVATTPAAASQAYFKKVTATLDAVKRAPSLGEQAAWLRRDAKRIGALPILNVDPELVAWGADVSARLSQTAANLLGEQQDVRVAVNAIDTPTPSTYDYQWNGDYYNKSINAPEYQRQLTNWRNQRRAAAGQQYSAAVEEATKTLDGLNASRNTVRQRMTTKYNVEF